ncbi:MAG: orotate phosphoribosyltransferase [Actinobacteria bacterium]|nr:orotate phosphoribosyltransferase [Actinomycetota bacterium]
MNFCSKTKNEKIENEKDKLLSLIKKNALRFGDFVLASGARSNYYIDARMITLDAEGSYLVAKLILKMLENVEVDSIGGLSIGADPIVSAVSTLSFIEGKPLRGFIVRKEPKKHGTQKWIEGPLRNGDKVAIVDDVVTTGGSILKAIEKVKEYDCKIVKIISIVDRNSGLENKLKDQGYTYEPIFCLKDLGIDNKVHK